MYPSASHVLDRAWFEPNLVVADPKQHYNTKWMPAQDRDRQRPYALVLPFAAALEVQKLDLATGRPLQVLAQLVERSLKPHPTARRSCWSCPA